MSGRKDKQTVGDRNKKLRTTNAVWRPVSTQASSNEGGLRFINYHPAAQTIRNQLLFAFILILSTLDTDCNIIFVSLFINIETYRNMQLYLPFCIMI